MLLPISTLRLQSACGRSKRRLPAHSVRRAGILQIKCAFFTLVLPHPLVFHTPLFFPLFSPPLFPSLALSGPSDDGGDS